MDERLEPDRADRLAKFGLGLAVVIYVGLALWLTRGATFTVDELLYFSETRGFSPSAILDPFSGHLTAVTRLLYASSLNLFGPAHLPLQIVTVLTAAAVAVCLFLLLRRRSGPLAALAMATVILFLGSTPPVLQGNATMWAQACAFGLAGFLALDRGTRRGDIAACLLLIGAVLSLEVGVAFAIGCGAWVIADGRRRARRLWIAIIPVAVYGAWFLWALRFDEPTMITLSNVLLWPTYSANSLAAGFAAVTGLGVDLSGESSLNLVDASWGRIVAVAAVAVVAVGVRRRGGSPLLWGTVAFLLAFWLAGALTLAPLRGPELSRYVYPAAVGAILVLGSGLNLPQGSRRVALAAVAIAVFALAANLWTLKERGAQVRTTSDLVKTRLGVLELERSIVSPDFTGAFEDSVSADDYLAGRDRFGSLGLSRDQLIAADLATRAEADRALDRIIAPRLAPASQRDVECGNPLATAQTEVEVPSGDVTLGSGSGGEVRLRRFADSPVIETGAIPPGGAARLSLPVDEIPLPWLASVPAGDLFVCTDR